MPGIVIHPLKTVYWTIPKNACTALKVHYAKLLKLKFKNPHKAGFEFVRKIIGEYFNYAFVRHPFQRLYSCWANKVADNHPVANSFINGIDAHVFKNIMGEVCSGMPFGDFVRVILSEETKCDLHWYPQSKQVPEGVVFYKLEEFPLGAFLPVLNKDHTGGRWQDHFTPEIYSIARKYYAEDLRRFNYSA